MEVRIAVIAGVAQVIVAFIALFGTLATASDRSSALSGSGGSPTTTTLAVSGESPTTTTLADSGESPITTTPPSAGASCASVIREYRDLVRSDPKLAASLIEARTDGVSPIDVNPDARRCGIDRAFLTDIR
jgi:hypothetical protein